jgi:hypothetical protein
MLLAPCTTAREKILVLAATPNSASSANASTISAKSMHEIFESAMRIEEELVESRLGQVISNVKDPFPQALV